MSDLVRLIRKNREGTVSVDGFRFTFRRPTDVEAHEIIESRAKDSEVASRFVIGWAKDGGDPVTENDVVGNGSSDAVAFDGVLWREWIADRDKLWAPITRAIVDAYKAHAGTLADAEKK